MAAADESETKGQTMSALPKAVCGRPRGFIKWHPRRGTRELLDAVASILDEYRDHLPLTIRQVFYRLVATCGYEKTERAYQRLCETLNKARRARLISFDAIRDDGFKRLAGNWWPGIEEFKRAVSDAATRYQIDRQAGQSRRLVVWCEAAGMAPQLQAVCDPYTIPVYSSGGFDSVTAKYQIARDFADLGAVTVLHIGDHDPSGVHVFGSLDEDVKAFLKEMGGHAEFIRLAVLPEHIEAFGLPTAPPKATDRRNFSGETVQAEALPPDRLTSILKDRITRMMDLDLFDNVLALEAEQRCRLQCWVETLGDEK